MTQKIKKVIEGYAHISAMFGLCIFDEFKETQSISKDKLLRELKEFEDKKVKITVEEIK